MAGILIKLLETLEPFIPYIPEEVQTWSIFLNIGTCSYEAGSDMEIFAVPPSDLEYKSPMCSTADASNLKYTLVVTVEMSMRHDECGPQQLSDIVRYLCFTVEPQYNEPFHNIEFPCISKLCL